MRGQERDHLLGAVLMSSSRWSTRNLTGQTAMLLGHELCFFGEAELNTNLSFLLNEGMPMCFLGPRFWFELLVLDCARRLSFLARRICQYEGMTLLQIGNLEAAWYFDVYSDISSLQLFASTGMMDYFVLNFAGMMLGSFSFTHRPQTYRMMYGWWRLNTSKDAPYDSQPARRSGQQ